MPARRFGPLVALILLAVAGRAAADTQPRVLILQSFGQHFAPFEPFVTEFRSELVRRSPTPLDVYEASLDAARFPEDDGQGAAFLAYLQGLFAASPPDLIVTIGGAAATFAQAHRPRLFPAAPLLMTALEARRVDPAALTPQDVVAAFDLRLPDLVETILEVEPDTDRLYVVLGSTPLERFWRAETERDLVGFAGRLDVEWSTGLGFAAILDRVAALPAEAAVIYGFMIVDGDGVPFEEDRAIAALSRASAAPVFGVYDNQLGAGVVGGRMLPASAMAEAAAGAAVRLLAGASAADVRVPPMPLGAPRFDSRVLRRFGIAEDRLPAESVVLFREPSAWERHRREILGAAGLIVVQSAFIAGLAASRRRLRASRAALIGSEDRLRQAAAAARDFAGRLIHAQEDERSRLARELHDDVTQRLAALAIEAGRAERGVDAAALATVRVGLAQLAGDVHALSYRLHPQILVDLGLVAALESECERVTDVEGLRVSFAARDLPDDLPAPATLCMFRVTQEALRNVTRHAQAREAHVTIAREDGDMVLVVEDDGAGFQPEAAREGPSLGIASMRQRVAAIGGTLRIEAAPGRGTRIEARAPVEAGAPCGRAS